jgi:hypothetical protein
MQDWLWRARYARSRCLLWKGRSRSAKGRGRAPRGRGQRSRLTNQAAPVNWQASSSVGHSRKKMAVFCFITKFKKKQNNVYEDNSVNFILKVRGKCTACRGKVVHHIAYHEQIGPNPLSHVSRPVV